MLDMINEWITPIEIHFLIGLLLSIFSGLVIGAEREYRGKDAGISTHMMVILGAMVFTLMSANVDPASKSRIAAQIVSGIGFLGAGLILKESWGVKNLTTAASLWVSAGIGMAYGFGFHFIGIMLSLAVAFIPKVPHVRRKVGPPREDEIKEE